MRTTVKLDTTVERFLKAEALRTRKTISEILNNLVRFAIEKKKQSPKKTFKVKSKSLGTIPGLNYDNIGELLEQIEGIDKR
jgi:hypothetical protein